MAQISLMVRVNAAPERVYESLATARGITGWFTEADFKANQQFGSMRLRLWDEVDFVVTENASPWLIHWKCSSAGHLWFDTIITFEIRSESEQTVVVFDHSGWAEVSDHYRDCAMSWAYFLESLRTYTETGVGTPEGVAPPCESTSA
jgi:uncharacterized protein YndB with AHSA1/START domain